MPTLFKRSNGVYYFISYTRDGRRRWVSTGERQKSDALRKLPAIDLDDVRRKQPPRLTIYIRDFLSFAASVYSQGSVGIYKKTLTHFLRVAGDLEISNISARHIDLYRQRRLGEVSAVTLNIELRTLRAAFFYAVRWVSLFKSPSGPKRHHRPSDQGAVLWTVNRKGKNSLTGLNGERVESYAKCNFVPEEEMAFPRPGRGTFGQQISNVSYAAFLK